jgi:DNA uptake protein ComE-like DNA-binding protein
MSIAEELLCSRKWRITHGLWMLWGWFPFAFTAWIGYLIIGIKAKNWKWIAAAVAFFIFGSLVLAVIGWVGGETDVQKGESYPEPYGTYMNIAMWSSFVVWLGNAAGLQWWVNRKWLVWRARNDKRVSTPWYASVTAGGPPNAQVDPQRVVAVMDNAFAHGSASSSPVGGQTSPIIASGHPSTSRASSSPNESQARAALDINTATQGELAALPGFDAATAAAVLAVRNQTGGFRDTAELVTRAGVKPHVLAGLQAWITTNPASSSVHPDPTPAPGTVPKSDNGRRLEF